MTVEGLLIVVGIMSAVSALIMKNTHVPKDTRQKQSLTILGMAIGMLFIGILTKYGLFIV